MWVARDKDGLLKLFLVKPMRSHLPNVYIWVNASLNKNNYVGEIYDSALFPDLKWEDEPIEVSLVPKMMNFVQEKIAESVDNYFDYVGHAQDIHPYSKEKEQKLYDEMCWRWQDYNEVKYDPKDNWDLNFDDYE